MPSAGALVARRGRVAAWACWGCRASSCSQAPPRRRPAARPQVSREGQRPGARCASGVRHRRGVSGCIASAPARTPPPGPRLGAERGPRRFGTSGGDAPHRRSVSARTAAAGKRTQASLPQDSNVMWRLGACVLRGMASRARRAHEDAACAGHAVGVGKRRAGGVQSRACA